MPLLNWFNRDADLTRAALVPYRLLEPVAKLSYGEDDSPNMLIEGDNLDALKALLPYYAGQVKCVFIDPPYNTRTDFDHYDDNLEHSQWLSMIYPRLELLRALLRQDGVIFATIDDNEAHYLKVVMDEIFGRANFVANAVWQKKYTVANDAKWFSSTHDHVLVYAVDKNKWFPNRLPRPAEMDARYKNPDKHPKGPWKATPLHAKSGSAAGAKLKYRFKNGVVWSPPPGTFSRYSEATLAAMDANDEIWFGKDGSAMPARKTFLEDISGGGVVAPTLWLHSEVGHNHEARDEAKAAVPEDAFKTPKPERLLQRILALATKPGDLVLDSFLGSGTTAAVAHKMGRRWIGIEMGEHARTHCRPRLVKVVDGDGGGISASEDWCGGGGFRFFKLGVPVFDENGHICESIRFEHLAAHVWFSETGTARSTRAKKDAFLGEHGGVGYYLLFNGILGDDSKSGGNVLTRRVLRSLQAFDGPKVIYGEACALPDEQLREFDITFKQTPYDIKAR
jgi:adenine-specific DNA-methyltransferase